jgi:hypothetical protein
MVSCTIHLLVSIPQKCPPAMVHLLQTWAHLAVAAAVRTASVREQSTVLYGAMIVEDSSVL